MHISIMLAVQAPVSGHLSPTRLVAAAKTILISGQLQLRTLFSRPEGVRLQELRLYLCGRKTFYAAFSNFSVFKFTRVSMDRA